MTHNSTSIQHTRFSPPFVFTDDQHKAQSIPADWQVLVNAFAAKAFFQNCRKAFRQMNCGFGMHWPWMKNTRGKPAVLRPSRRCQEVPHQMGTLPCIFSIPLPCQVLSSNPVHALNHENAEKGVNGGGAYKPFKI